MTITKIPKLSKNCKDITGQRFGRLVVIKILEKRKSGKVAWRCLCDCGNICEVTSTHLQTGHTQSCGCLRGKGKRKHGMSRTSIYTTWIQIIQRCENPKCRNFKDYGGRGIKVCERWRNSFEVFYADVGDRPKGKTFDRWPDNNGDYEPTNWRWATRKEQMSNTRSLRWFRGWHKDMMCQFMSNNQHEFARKHKLCRRHISACLHGRQKIHKGWTFLWIELGPSF